MTILSYNNFNLKIICHDSCSIFLLFKRERSINYEKKKTEPERIRMYSLKRCTQKTVIQYNV